MDNERRKCSFLGDMGKECVTICGMTYYILLKEYLNIMFFGIWRKGAGRASFFM